MRPIGFNVGRRLRVFPWAGAWSIIDRSGGHRFSLKQCSCHKFSLFIGPFGIEYGPR